MTTEHVHTLARLGITMEDAHALRRVSMTLRHWYASECGNGDGCIERDDKTGRPYWLTSATMRRRPIADKERGAEKRLAAIMTRYPTLQSYLQTDPRGNALYILRPGDIPAGADPDSCYSRGVVVPT